MKIGLKALALVGVAFLVSGCKGKVESACADWDAKANCSCAQNVVDKLTEGAKDKEAKVGLAVAAFKKDKLAAQNYASQLGLIGSATFYAMTAEAWSSTCGFKRLP